MDSDDSITHDDMNRLRHAVGVHHGVTVDQWGYRNFYCSPKEGPIKESMMRLHRCELAMLHRETQSYSYFEITRAGCKRAGLNLEQTERALENRGG